MVNHFLLVRVVPRLLNAGTVGDTVNLIADEIARLRIQSTPQVQADETPAGTRLRIVETGLQSCFVARHTVGSEEGQDAFGNPIEIGTLTIEVPANLFLPDAEGHEFDKRPAVWKASKLFIGTELADLTTLETAPTNTTLNTETQAGTVGTSALFGSAILFTLSTIFTVPGVNPFYEFETSNFSFWEKVVTIETATPLWEPLHTQEDPENPSIVTTFVKVPYWRTPIGFTAPFIDLAEEMMGHELTGEGPKDVVAICKIRVYACEMKFANAISGDLDENCLPVDNSTPARWFPALQPGFYNLGVQEEVTVWSLLRSVGPYGDTSQIAMSGPYTEYTGLPERWLIPTALVDAWDEQSQRITAAQVVADGVLTNETSERRDYYLDTQVEVPVMRCIKRNGQWTVSSFMFNPYAMEDLDGTFNPRDAEEMVGYIDFSYSPTPPQGSYVIGGTPELVMRALTQMDNCDFDETQPDSTLNPLTVPYYAGGWRIKPRGFFSTDWIHDRVYGTAEHECGGQTYVTLTATEENASTWHSNAEPLDVYKPAETLFHFPRNGYQLPHGLPGFQFVSEDAVPPPEPCPEP